MAGYNWLEHDGRTAGTQVINDIENNVQIKVYLLKTPSGSSGGSWAARIGGQPLDPSELYSILQAVLASSYAILHEDRPSRVSLITYYGLESLGSLQLDSHEDEGKEVGQFKCTHIQRADVIFSQGIDGPITLTGSVQSLGGFTFRQIEGGTRVVKAVISADFQPCHSQQ